MVVESRERYRRSLKQMLIGLGRRVTVVGTASEAIRTESDFRPDVMLVSLSLEDVPGFPVVAMLQERLGTPLIAMSSSPTLAGAIESVRRGAVDYINIQSTPDEFDVAISKALKESQSTRALEQVRQQVKDRYGLSRLLTQSPRMLDVFDQYERLRRPIPF